MTHHRHTGVVLPFAYGFKTTITRAYGEADHGFPTSNQYDAILHYSVDFSAPIGTAVLAQGNGRVIASVGYVPDAPPGKYGQSPYLGPHNYGNYVTVQYDDGYVATYMHLKQSTVPLAGSFFSIGSQIGTVGSTGATSGAHLHATYGATTINFGGGSNDTFANGSQAANSTPPVYFMTSSDGILRDNWTIASDNGHPLTQVRPSVGGPSSEQVGVGAGSFMQGWFFASDQNDDPITWWAIKDTNSDPASGYFKLTSGLVQNSSGQFVPISGRAPANTIVYVNNDAMDQTQFIGGSRATVQDGLYINAQDPYGWGQWKYLTVTTSQFAASSTAAGTTTHQSASNVGLLIYSVRISCGSAGPSPRPPRNASAIPSARTFYSASRMTVSRLHLAVAPIPTGGRRSEWEQGCS